MSIEIIETSDGSYKVIGLWTIHTRPIITGAFHVPALAGKEICRFYSLPNDSDFRAKINLILESKGLPITTKYFNQYLQECNDSEQPTKVDILVQGNLLYYVVNMVNRQDPTTYPASLSLNYDI